MTSDASARPPIRALTTAEELRAVERLQRRVWGFEDVEVVPLHVLLTAARHGGLVLGAYDGPELRAFAFAFRGCDEDGTPALCSHLLAVDPVARGRGLGLALKWAQRRHALETMGLRRAVWTFDPLEHGNARLNTTRLGATSRRYLVDLYGPLRDQLNAGLPTDRLEMRWDLAAPHVEALAAGRPSATPHDPGPRLDPSAPDGRIADPGDAARVRLGAPTDAQELRGNQPELARAWRMHLRAGLRTCFARGYRLVGAGHDDAGPDLRLARAVG